MNDKGNIGPVHPTSHTWTHDGQLIVFTSEGKIIICRDSGEFKSVLQDSPHGVNIVSCATHQRGFILGGANGEILVYTKTDDMENPF
jgi:tricorn protease-like protein